MPPKRRVFEKNEWETWLQENWEDCKVSSGKACTPCWSITTLLIKNNRLFTLVLWKFMYSVSFLRGNRQHKFQSIQHLQIITHNSSSFLPLSNLIWTMLYIFYLHDGIVNHWKKLKIIENELFPLFKRKSNLGHERWVCV